MKSYYFIKYDNNTNQEHLRKYSHSCSVVCFDFEDSIQKHGLKSLYRQYFRKIFDNIIPSFGFIKTGLRINNNTHELEKDLVTIAGLTINSIIVPKVDNESQLNIIKKKLSEINLNYDEIIPVIETKAGLSNLPDIVKTLSEKINKIGFGHCDYNLSINAFPFFHQNTKEYWKWIDKFYKILHPQKLIFINSPYLELENYDFFREMLNHINNIFGFDCGQFTLSTQQSVIVKNFKSSVNKSDFINSLSERLDSKIPKNFTEKLINDYNSDRTQKSFTIVKMNKQLISPQEYISAKNYLLNKKPKVINMTFVGGCFPVQYDIPVENLFHFLLKRKFEKETDIELNINIIRYERLSNCLEKIKKYQESNPVDILVFHVRPEPYLRPLKLYYRFSDSKGNYKHSFNLPYLKILNPEKYDLLLTERGYNFSNLNNVSIIHKLLTDLNYAAGYFLGNKRYSLKKYMELVLNVIKFCKESDIKLSILGTAIRTNTMLEPFLCNQLNKFFRNKLAKINNDYIECTEQYSEDGELYFNINGIHAKENFHELIAQKLFDRIRPVISSKS